MKKSILSLTVLGLLINSSSFVNAATPKKVTKSQEKIDNIQPAIPQQKPEAQKAPIAVEVAPTQYSVEITVKDIPAGQQTLFIPIKIDTMVLDFDKVALEGLAASNILAVASSSKDKVGPGIGLIKLDESGLPNTLTLKALLKPVGEGQTSVTVTKVANEPSLPSKGLVINDGVTISVKTPLDLEVIEKVEGAKKKLVLNERKLTLDIQRLSQKEETIFIPVIYNKSVVDIDETFGHTIISQGISMKSFNGSAINEDGAGVELILSADAPKDFTIDLDLVARKAGTSKLSIAFPQTGHSAIVSGPVVDIVPQVLTVANTK